MRGLIVFLCVLLAVSCIDRIDLNEKKSNEEILIVDGSITNIPGPYEVKLFRSSSVNGNLVVPQSMPAKKVILKDDIGNSEILSTVQLGIYRTSLTGMRGVVGRSYKIIIELPDGRIYESIPERINPSGNIDSLYWRWNEYSPSNGPSKYGFDIYLDSKFRYF